ncbi:xanthine dehydrogenase family protein molybdopterin-binding subunit [Methylobacterium komagatae]
MPADHIKALSRRNFLKAGAAAGVAVKVSFLAPPAKAQLAETGLSAGSCWTAPGKPHIRLDAVAKVTGAKTFSRDYRSRDLAGWPEQQAHAFLIAATSADRRFTGLDLSRLPASLQPDRIVRHEDLVADKISVPHADFFGDWFLVPQGQTPRLLGQPVAILIYNDFPRFNTAKRALRFADDVVQYGEKTGPKPPAHYGASRWVRIEGDTPDAIDRFSPYEHSPIFAGFSGDEPAWPAPGQDGLFPKGMEAAAAIAAEIDGAGDDALVMRRTYQSQSTDASAMEADNGNVWYDPATGTLHLMMATQSPYDVAEAAAELVSKSRFPLKEVDLKVGYTVGYGTKDHHIFPFLCVVAALYGGGRPVRLANDRFEQFQNGLKRHAFRMDIALLVDKASGRFRAMTGRYVCDGGGRPNYSVAVSFVGATAAQSIYYLPKSDFQAIALASRAVEAGSTRGFGTLQTMSATEMLVDEAAALLKIDAIALRLRNVMRTGQRNSQGAVPAGALRNEEILNKAAAHPLWREREARKAAYEAAHPGHRYGVGFAQVHKDYGTGAEAAVASLELDARGRLRLRHVAHEMGPGVTTSQAAMVGEILGRAPSETEFGVVCWPEMPLHTTDQPYTTPQAEEDRRAQDPRWTPRFTSPMSATNSAYYLGHATRTAAKFLVDHAIWPAARALWARGGKGGALASYNELTRDTLRLADGKVMGGGLATLSLDEVAAEAHRLGLPVGVTLHTFNRWQWAEADFDLPGVGRTRLPIDALSLRYGAGASPDRRALMDLAGWHFLPRMAAYYPPTQRNNVGTTYYSPMATLAEVAVDTGSGEVTILSHHSILECGRQIVPALVSGQVQGGLAMGIGHTLKEVLPLYEDGPGDGTWNWNRYELPRARDVAPWNQTVEILPPLSETDPPKGIAEVVMIAVVPALANAVAHAIGHRFHELPIRPERIREALA